MMNQYFTGEMTAGFESKGIDIVRELASDMNRDELSVTGNRQFRTKNGNHVSPYEILQAFEKI